MSRTRAVIRTSHEDSAAVARSVAPDNTDEIDTRLEDGRIVTTITREATGGLRTSADDYLVNLAVAADVVQTANQRSDSTNHE